MKLTHLLPLLTATALASTESSSNDAPTEDPTPVGALWTSSWNTSTLAPYTQSCRSFTTYKATIYKLANLYPDLESFAPELKVFYHRQLYPGSWDGLDKHGNERELLMMQMSDVPFKVREWIKSQGEKQRHYSVHGGETVFFAPGAVYPILPLWVEGKEEEGCEGVFDGLEDYANEPADGATIGKVTHKETGDKEVEFTVEALMIGKKGQAKDGGERSEL